MTILKYWYFRQTTTLRKTVREAIRKKCEISEDTFYNYLEKKHAPKVIQKIISDVTGIPVENLYKTINQ